MYLTTEDYTELIFYPARILLYTKFSKTLHILSWPAHPRADVCFLLPWRYPWVMISFYFMVCSDSTNHIIRPSLHQQQQVSDTQTFQTERKQSFIIWSQTPSWGYFWQIAVASQKRQLKRIRFQFNKRLEIPHLGPSLLCLSSDPASPGSNPIWACGSLSKPDPVSSWFYLLVCPSVNLWFRLNCPLAGFDPLKDSTRMRGCFHHLYLHKRKVFQFQHVTFNWFLSCCSDVIRLICDSGEHSLMFPPDARERRW